MEKKQISNLQVESNFFWNIYKQIPKNIPCNYDRTPIHQDDR